MVEGKRKNNKQVLRILHRSENCKPNFLCFFFYIGLHGSMMTAASKGHNKAATGRNESRNVRFVGIDCAGSWKLTTSNFSCLIPEETMR